MTEELKKTDAIDQFAILAEEYCSFVDSLKAGRPKNFYRSLEFFLARLHSEIMDVEMASGCDIKHEDQFVCLRVTHEQWKEITLSIAEVTEQERMRLYDEHMNAGYSDEYCATRAYMLWDDLGDIYRDLLDGLKAWQAGTDIGRCEAAWQWRFGYESHWGDHLARAMQTVHEARYRLYAD